MDRRAFLSLSLFAPFALKSGLVCYGAEYSPVTNVIEASFSKSPSSPKGTLWQIPRQQPAQMMGLGLAGSSPTWVRMGLPSLSRET